MLSALTHPQVLGQPVVERGEGQTLYASRDPPVREAEYDYEPERGKNVGPGAGVSGSVTF